MQAAISTTRDESLLIVGYDHAGGSVGHVVILAFWLHCSDILFKYQVPDLDGEIFTCWNQFKWVWVWIELQLQDESSVANEIMGLESSMHIKYFDVVIRST